MPDGFESRLRDEDTVFPWFQTGKMGVAAFIGDGNQRRSGWRLQFDAHSGHGQLALVDYGHIELHASLRRASQRSHPEEQKRCACKSPQMH
jgi:hypothetical protein